MPSSTLRFVSRQAAITRLAIVAEKKGGQIGRARESEAFAPGNYLTFSTNF
jgi:hypothetical protein